MKSVKNNLPGSRRKASFMGTLECLGSTFIYALMDDKIRYIGLSDFPEKRIQQHIYQSKKRNKTLKEKWICRCLENGIEIKLKIIRKQLRPERAAELERQIIKNLGDKIFNISHGGEGVKTWEISAPKEYWRDLNTYIAMQNQLCLAGQLSTKWQRCLFPFEAVKLELFFNADWWWERQYHEPFASKMAPRNKWGVPVEIAKWRVENKFGRDLYGQQKDYPPDYTKPF